MSTAGHHLSGKKSLKWSTYLSRIMWCVTVSAEILPDEAESERMLKQLYSGVSLAVSSYAPITLQCTMPPFKPVATSKVSCRCGSTSEKKKLSYIKRPK